MGSTPPGFDELKTVLTEDEALLDELQSRGSDPLTLWALDRPWIHVQVNPAHIRPASSHSVWVTCRACFLLYGVDQLALSDPPWEAYLVYTVEEMQAVTHQARCDKCKERHWELLKEAP